MILSSGGALVRSLQGVIQMNRDLNSGHARHQFISYWIIISFSWGPNMLYCNISSFQPMEIYVDDEAKLTLHGLVQVWTYTI